MEHFIKHDSSEGCHIIISNWLSVYCCKYRNIIEVVHGSVGSNAVFVTGRLPAHIPGLAEWLQSWAFEQDLPAPGTV